MEQYLENSSTLLIGLGGLGSSIVNNIVERIGKNYSVEFYCIDTDLAGLQTLDSIPNSHRIMIGFNESIGDTIMRVPDCDKWFPRNPILFDRALNIPPGQIRSIARLEFEAALYRSVFTNFIERIERMAFNCVLGNSDLHVSIVTSLCGGTGSGIFIQIALLIRKHLQMKYPNLKVWIHGDLVMTHYAKGIFPPSDVKRMHANTYAALKELNAINESLSSNAPAVKLKYLRDGQDEDGYVDIQPFDYCFLYNRHGINAHQSEVADSIIERLISRSSKAITNALAEAKRKSASNKANCIYGAVSLSEFDSEKAFFKHCYLQAINLADQSTEKILVVSSPGQLGTGLDRISSDFTIVERANDFDNNIKVTQYALGIEMGQLDELKYGSGEYYKAYRAAIAELPTSITPHLDRNWHVSLNDIGEIRKYDQKRTEAIPSEPFVFVSYSSREANAANQLRQVLEANGIKCWIAPQSIPAGSDYACEIPKAIKSCSAFVLMLSKNSQESVWVPLEVGQALGKGKIVIPFHIDQSDLSDRFSFYLSNSQRISAFNRLSEAYKELVNRLKELM